MNTVAQSFAGVLILCGGFICLMNWVMLYQSYRTKRFHSAVPLFGALLLGFGMSLIPITRPYAWSAILLDYGTLVLLFALPRMLYDGWTTCRFNLLHEYSGNCGNRTASLCLFRKGIFIIKLRIERPKGELGIIGTGTIGTWHKEDSRLELTITPGSERAVFEFFKSGNIELLRQVEGFARFEKDNDCSLAGIDFVSKQVAKNL